MKINISFFWLFIFHFNLILAQNDTCTTNKNKIKSFLSINFYAIQQNHKKYWFDSNKWASKPIPDLNTSDFRYPIGYEVGILREFWYGRVYFNFGTNFRSTKQVYFVHRFILNPNTGASEYNLKHTLFNYLGLLNFKLGFNFLEFKNSKILVYAGFQKCIISKDVVEIVNDSFHQITEYYPGYFRDFENFGILLRKKVGIFQFSIPIEVEFGYLNKFQKSLNIYYKTGLNISKN